MASVVPEARLVCRDFFFVLVDFLVDCQGSFELVFVVEVFVLHCSELNDRKPSPQKQGKKRPGWCLYSLQTNIGFEGHKD